MCAPEKRKGVFVRAGGCTTCGGDLEIVADAENGPHPSDLYQPDECGDCLWTADVAWMESICLAHRRRMGECLPCSVLDDDELARELTRERGGSR